MHNFFAANGVKIESVTLMRDRFTGQARGFGFVEIADDAAAQRAVAPAMGKSYWAEPWSSMNRVR